MADLISQAENGKAEAQNDLGVRYEQGLGVGRDDRRAATLYQSAADSGLSVAQANLGRLYARGQGVSQDFTLARSWFERAANQGSGEAMDNLGRIHAEGDGVAKDEVEALKWMILAQSTYKADGLRQPTYATANRVQLKVTMSAAEIAEAERRAKSWNRIERQSCVARAGCSGPPAPAYVSEQFSLLTRLGIDPNADFVEASNYHWSWTSHRELAAGDYRCPTGSSVDVSRSIVVMRSAAPKACRGRGGDAVQMLKVFPDGSAEPMSAGAG